MIKKAVILDGYTDEPAGLGVPPYINTYPRLVAGAIWLARPEAEIKYWTIDSARKNLSVFIDDAKRSDVVIFIHGMEVPGKYLGGKPMSIGELEYFATIIRDAVKILTGPVARFGTGFGGGSVAYSTKRFHGLIDYIVRGDPEIFFYEAASDGLEKADPFKQRENYDLADRAFIEGARIVTQHPNHGKNLVVEIETYRGCPRYIVGGCSFCIEPRYGKPVMRPVQGIVEEVRRLYLLGVRHVRLGKQPDILTYMARGVGEREYPEPNPEALRQLFHGIRTNAPGLITLHIDNVNPGTIVNHREKAIEALKIIVEYHTPGDVAALGVESFDEEVIKRNKLKTTPEETLEAIRVINKIGSMRGWNGLPHLLPGINLLYGLPKESKETYRINYEYLMRILREGLLVRRVNIRKVVVLESTPLWIQRRVVEKILGRHSGLYEVYRRRVMRDFDREMMRRIIPPGTLLSYLWVEKVGEKTSTARFPGSYPVAVKLRGKFDRFSIVDALVIKHSAKSVLGNPVASKKPGHITSEITS